MLRKVVRPGVFSASFWLAPHMTAHLLIRPLSVVVAVTALLLAIPLVAMQFTREVNWSVGDFVSGALLLVTAGTAIVLGVRRAATGRGKASVVAAVLLLLLLSRLMKK